MNKTRTATAAVLAVTVATLLAADTITGLIRVESSITKTKAGTISTVTETLVNSYKWGGTGALGTGTTAAAMSVLYVASGSLAAGGTNTLDLYGSVQDNFGATVNLTRVKWLQLSPSNSMTTAQSVLMRPAPANGFATWMTGTNDALRVFAGGTVAIMAPATNAYAVTESTGDLLDIVNESTNTTTYTLIVGGQ